MRIKENRLWKQRKKNKKKLNENLLKKKKNNQKEIFWCIIPCCRMTHLIILIISKIFPLQQGFINIFNIYTTRIIPTIVLQHRNIYL